MTADASRKVYFDHDWIGVERSFRRAIELRPGMSNAHSWYGEYLLAMGRIPDARREIDQAQELDPLSLIINMVSGHPDFYRREFGRAAVRYQSVLDLDPGFIPARLWLARALLMTGQHARAIEVLRKAVALAPDDTKLQTALALAWARAGEFANARRLASELEAARPSRYISAYDLAAIHAALGERAQALTLLRAAYDERSYHVVFLRVDPFFDSLRAEPAFRALLQRLYPS